MAKKYNIRSILNGLVTWVGTLEEKVKQYLMTWLNWQLRHDKEKEETDGK